ncbi:MAG: Abi-alpha family protein [Thermodesulfovibrionales bacterium]
MQNRLFLQTRYVWRIEMSEETEAVKESAKAIQEIAKTTSKAIDAGKQVGDFVAKYIAGPLEEGIGIFHDKLKYMRWERQVRLIKRSEEFLKEVGLSSPSRPVQMKIAIPLIQAAFLEENDELQDRWAALLVNASNINSGIDVKKAYISILEDMSPFDANILEKICSVPLQNQHVRILTYKLPEEAVVSSEVDFLPEPNPDVQLSLGNLIRLGCLTANITWGGGQILTCVESTLLGRSLVEACKLKKGIT